MTDKPELPDWERLLAAERHTQHRVSMDGDHVLEDLRERFDDVLATLEAVAGGSGLPRKAGYSPPWQRRGGRASNNVPVPLKARTGWFGQLPINRWLERTTPSARVKVASRNFLGRAATPHLPPLPSRGI